MPESKRVGPSRSGTGSVVSVATDSLREEVDTFPFSWGSGSNQGQADDEGDHTTLSFRTVLSSIRRVRSTGSRFELGISGWRPAVFAGLSALRHPGEQNQPFPQEQHSESRDRRSVETTPAIRGDAQPLGLPV